MRTFNKVAVAVVAVVVIAALCTGVVARAREQRISRITPGMYKRDVERLLGAGGSDIMSPACERCPTGRTQFSYRGNPSLWYGRLEDTLVVCYTNDVVCDTTRVGL
jgi:hypothetical protein